MTKLQRLTIILTAFNLILLMFGLVQLRPAVAQEHRPHVKLVTTEDGSGLVLGGDKGHAQLLSRATDPFIKIVTADGRERTIKP
jgi:hypothetical protein